MATEAPVAASAGHPRLYVYYGIADADRGACVAAVRAAQAALMRRHPGLVAEVLVKVPGQDTLMETYAWAPPADGAGPAGAPDWTALDAEVGTCTARWTLGARHLEVFAPCA